MALKSLIPLFTKFARLKLGKKKKSECLEHPQDGAVWVVVWDLTERQALPLKNWRTTRYL